MPGAVRAMNTPTGGQRKCPRRELMITHRTGRCTRFENSPSCTAMIVSHAITLEARKQTANDLSSQTGSDAAAGNTANSSFRGRWQFISAHVVSRPEVANKSPRIALFLVYRGILVRLCRLCCLSWVSCIYCEIGCGWPMSPIWISTRRRGRLAAP